MAGKGTVGSLLVEMRAELGGLRTDVKEMETIFKTSFGNVTSMATSFGRILGASFSAGAIIAYGRQVVNLGGQLKDLSQQTGISGQTLSGLKSVLEENGTSLDAFAKGIFTAQKNLGGIKNESDPAAQAVKALGLNLKQLQEADTEKFLEMVTDALGNIENPLNRNALGAALLGKSFRELGPALMEAAGQLQELRKNGLSDDDIEILDKFGDAWTRLANTIEVYVAGQIVKMLEDFNHIWTDIQVKILQFRQFMAGATFSDRGALQSQIDELLSPQSHTAVQGRAAFKAMPDDAAAKKAADEMKRLVEGIQKSNVALQAQIIEMQTGKEAAENYTLAQKEMEENSKGISAALKKEQDRRRELTEQLRVELQAREDMQALSKAWVKDIDAIVTAQEKWAAIKMDAESLGLDDLAKTLDEIGRKYTNLIVKAEEAAAAAGASPEEIEAVRRRFQIERALEQVRARVGFTGEGVDAEEEARARADKLGEDLANSLTSGMKNTLMGIETGQQSLGEGMRNLVRNMLLELQGAVFDKAILEPLKAIAAGFISGLVGALDDAANTQLKDWAKNLGKQVSSWLGSSLSSIFGGGGGGGAAAGSMSALDAELGWMGFAKGGMIPSFASGGLFIGHGGEFVMQKRAVDSIGADKLSAANQSGKLPGSGATAVTVEINGDITPRQPNMTPDQVVKVTAGNITNDGMVMSAIEQRLRLRGK